MEKLEKNALIVLKKLTKINKGFISIKYITYFIMDYLKPRKTMNQEIFLSEIIQRTMLNEHIFSNRFENL